MQQNQKLVFPKIRKVQLHRFSLYTLEPNIEIDIRDGVFCLAGANGLGKSTFLAAVNFAITGLVRDRDESFRSIDEFYKDNLKYSQDFFTGKIVEDDREAAAITVHLQVDDKFYQLTRGVFESNELRQLTIKRLETDETLFEGTEKTGEQRNFEYQQRITQDIGLKSFQQFVFLHHMVFTFDESRHLLTRRCSLCGAEDDSVIKSIRKKIDNNVCPLCESPISEQSPTETAFAKLKELDNQIQEAKKRLNQANETKNRVSHEFQIAKDQLDSAKSELQGFESVNQTVIYKDALLRYQQQIDESNRLKETKYKERDEKRKGFLKLERELQQRYTFAEEDFVPLFRQLAFQFLGLDLDIRMDFSTSIISPGISLILEVKGSMRREEHQLSESQRFFLDIALRMALAQYSSDSQGKACLFIDTPEGSLDIAYESRAGQMFADFVDAGHCIIMTANINSSQILRKLASRCGRERMTLHRMTSWTELSEVQLAEETLFEDAYNNIERMLDSRD